MPLTATQASLPSSATIRRVETLNLAPPATSRPLLQSCIARLSRHARRGMVTIYTATSGKARETYRAISAFLSKVASASQLSLEERRQRIIAHAFRKYGTIRRMFPPDIGGQMTMPLA